jgi:hypothetical protein
LVEQNSEEECGAVTEQKVSSLRAVQEIKGLYNAPDLVLGIRSRISDWFGHVIRKDKKILEKNI